LYRHGVDGSRLHSLNISLISGSTSSSDKPSLSGKLYSSTSFLKSREGVKLGLRSDERLVKLEPSEGAGDKLEFRSACLDGFERGTTSGDERSSGFPGGELTGIPPEEKVRLDEA